MSKNYETDDKMVSHPSHYQTKSGLEANTVIKAFTEDLVGTEAINTGHILRYVLRWKKKNGIQDLRKAMWYLQDLINFVESNEQEKTTYEVTTTDGKTIKLTEGED